ncbi:uncharacterized protein LOC133810364 [Humulus lupulus]|uniref:uncharacterized protein LOC133810364 n=1 Tax=Humulus lupulus TaxID=3486 RepID=UPI002B408E73|nr:uncharacterized protein LOC133810364 [Humulus lupulus]
MANPGAGTKFVSVNLNKSYGQPSHHHHHHPHNANSYGSSRLRAGGHGTGGGGGGGGMVVLSRPRSSQKAGPKLSVPPPLNLPSLRKEHEKFDSLGTGGGPAGGGVSGSGSRPSSSGMGWTKPGPIALQEKDGLGDQGADGTDQVLNGSDGAGKGSSVYMPPSARSGTVGSSAPTSTLAFPPLEKASVLRGEDFPSLKAALPSSSGNGQRQKDSLNQKQKQALGDESHNEQRNGSRLSTPVDMRPQLHSSRLSSGSGMNGNVETNGFGGSQSIAPVRKQEEYFPGPFPLVRVNPRSDWADDERDTSHGLIERGRDHGFSKSEAYWDRDFDMPRVSVLPHKPVHNTSERWGQRDDETGKVTSSEVPKGDPYARDIRAPSREGREGNLWKSSILPKDGSSVVEVGARQSNLNGEMHKENKYAPSHFRENAHGDFGRREVGYGQGGKQSWHNTIDSHGTRGADRNTRERYGSEQHSRYRDSALQNNSMTKSSYTSGGGRGMHVTDPILNFGKEKRLFTKSEKPYAEDPFMKDFGTGFDGRDPFSGGLLGVVKRKKDAVKQTDFHDPVRESFEAELERVQKMQEQERRRIIEEHERALELARREEEERARMAREQEDRQRKLEEEAREATWRAEQERLEAMRKAEELRIAREEEKRRMFMEEERRKHAAKQKLLELEEKIAKRQAETTKPGSSSSALADDRLPMIEKEKDASRAVEVSDWEDGERMVERITTSASSDSSSLNRNSEMGSRSQFTRESSAAFIDRGKPVNSWRRDAYDNGNNSTLHVQDQDIGNHSPRRDASIGGRSFPRKEFYGGAGVLPSRTYQKGGISDPPMDDFIFNNLKGQRWNLSGDGDQYSRNTEIDSEVHDHLVEKFDVGWGQGQSQGRPRGNSHPQYPDRLYPNSEADMPYSFGRSRYSMRQPRVLPPPSIASMHKTSYRSEIERPGPSAFLDSERQYNHAVRSEPTLQTSYDSSHRENLGQRDIIDVQQENEQKLDGKSTPRCDSQSSLSVSSPPSSPTHLSNDDLDDTRESSLLSAEGEHKDVSLSGQENEPVSLPSNAGEENMSAASCASVGDDEEWAVENNEQLQEQEEYDEDEDRYQEEDEVHEGDEENIDLHQEFESMHLEEKGSPDMMNNLVLGFNEGVEVGMPNDDLGRSARNDETAFVGPLVSSRSVEEQRSFDRICSDGETLQPLDGCPQVSSENEVQDLAVQQSNAPHTTQESELVDHVDAPSSSGLSSHHPVVSSANVASHSSNQAVTCSIPAVQNQAEVPLKLQFGLFSGPSLIPSPVPAIQIGSIQMPLHLHPQVGSSLSRMHPSQPPLFQFGQLRYSSPISQGVVPLAPHSMSFVQPNVPSSFSFNQTPGGSLPIQSGQDSSQSLTKNDSTSRPADKQSGVNSRHMDVSQGNMREDSLLPARENAEISTTVQRGRSELSRIGDNNSRSDLGVRAADEGHHNLVVENYNAMSFTQELEGQPQTGAVLSQTVTKEKGLNGPKVQGLVSSGRGKRYIFAVKNSGSRSYPAPESTTHPESSGYQRRPRRHIQRTEFRIREGFDKRQPAGFVSSDDLGMDEKSNAIGRGIVPSVRTGPKRVIYSHKAASKQAFESDSSSSVPLGSREVDSASRAERGSGKESSIKGQSIPQSGEGKLKRNICSEEAVDAPLQSGIVRVFEQPGIEAPSDEDDFIEVRSKRQMLNDRREQREKEIKAKSRVAKVPRRSRPTSKTTSTNSSKVSASSGREAPNNIRPEFVATEGRELGNRELSSGFNTTLVSQPLAPIGTPAMKSDSQTIRPVQTSSHASGAVKNIGSGLLFDNRTKVIDSVQTSLNSWGNSRINQQVMALTQTQLDEAMKPGQFDSRASVGNQTSSVSDSSMTSSSILTKDKLFSSTASPVNSLLAGEKIQFGAVTSPTILHHSIRAVSHGIGPPGPCRTEVQLSHSLGGAKNDCDILFEKDKHTTKSCVHLEDCEAEAEAAASAVAVAAISSDEIVGNGRGTCSVSVSDTKSFGSTRIDGITTGGASDSRFTCQSRAEESLSVSLPADLSVETPPISMWPPLPSPQNSSSQMLSHFPGGPPSHFPFFEMNPMLGGPVFAFGPHDESISTTQSQSQKSTAPASAPVGTWQQCHSGVDSFYGPPAGFTGPFISPPGGIPGVQGPPHMVVYNHFAPVGQFGQVGLSFMGTTYIPSGKQPDWKHSPASSAMVVGEGEMNNLNMVSGQRNPANMPTPIQHLAPGSPLLPMASPLAMFDVSPFQSSPDMSVQARWPHVPASSLQSVPLSMPLQQQAVAVLPSKLIPVDQSLTGNRFPESRNTSSSDRNRNYPVTTDATVSQLPDELGLVNPSSTTGKGVSAHNVVSKSSSVSMNSDTSKSDVAQNVSSSGSGQNTSSNVKSQPSQHKSNISGQQYGHSSGYNYHRGGGPSQRSSSAGEWTHRRPSFHGRNQSVGGEKSFHSSKMKQIYVAKQTSTSTGSSTQS